MGFFSLDVSSRLWKVRLIEKIHLFHYFTNWKAQILVDLLILVKGDSSLCAMSFKKREQMSKLVELKQKGFGYKIFIS